LLRYLVRPQTAAAFWTAAWASIIFSLWILYWTARFLHVMMQQRRHTHIVSSPNHHGLFCVNAGQRCTEGWVIPYACHPVCAENYLWEISKITSGEGGSASTQKHTQTPTNTRKHTRTKIHTNAHENEISRRWLLGVRSKIWYMFYLKDLTWSATQLLKWWQLLIDRFKAC